MKQDAGWLIFGLFLGLIAFATTGCSFQLELGYHGQTGRDDRTQTQLVRSSGGAVRPVKDEDRY